MTAVQWLEEKLVESGINFLSEEVEFIEQAKEMEEQQQDEFAIGFADWLIKRQASYFESLEELLEIYKKEKGL
jgi:hypothetical protein